MKHPRYEVLQDYFENALNKTQESLVKEHLLNCDQCTKVLSDFTQIESRIKMAPTMKVSGAMKEKIFSDARQMLAARKQHANEKAQRLEELKVYFNDWKETIFPEIKIPALQLCSLSIALMVFVNIERQEGMEEETYVPLTVEVNEYSHIDVPHKVEKK